MTTSSLVAVPAPEVRPGAGRLARLWRGRPEDARWVRPALWALLLVTAVLYVWDLGASGYANSFYSAAVQAGSQSWKAFFFGSLDAANAITVDKPPAALWPMALSVRIFGLSSWAVLVPEALMGVATAAVLYAAVRRQFSAVAGLLSVAAFALTPVAALMFRFNNPDAMLALLMTVTVYCVLRALEQGRTRWLLWAGAAVGLAFLAKTLQAFLVLPPLAVLYAVSAPVRPLRRLGQLALAGLVLLVTGGWWVAVVELWPAASRPFVGGSQHNSFLELTFGYNGLGRISGDETGSVGGGRGGGPGGGGGGMWGETGLGRMFNAEVGGQVSWLLPAALLLLAAGLVLVRRTRPQRSAFLAWGGALLVTGAVFSFMAGIFHQYYTVALAPYIAALVGMGAVTLWARRALWWVAAALGVSVALTAWWAYVLLGRTPDWLPWLRWAILAGGLASALALALSGRLGRWAYPVAGLACLTALAGPFAYTLSTVGTGHAGSIVTAGPAGASRMGGPGGGFPGRRGELPGGFPGGGTPAGQNGGGAGGFPTGQNGQGGQNGGGQNGGGGQRGGGNGQAPGGQAPGGAGNAPGGAPGRAGGFPGGRGGGMGGGGMGGLLDGQTVSAKAKTLLEKNAGDYTWVAASSGSQNAASYQLATGKPVMAIGGFNGSDPYPSLSRFKELVAQGRIHYYISGGMGGMGGQRGGSDVSSKISSWVEATFTKVTAGQATFYDLTRPSAASGS